MASAVSAVQFYAGTHLCLLLLPLGAPLRLQDDVGKLGGGRGLHRDRLGAVGVLERVVRVQIGLQPQTHGPTHTHKERERERERDRDSDRDGEGDRDNQRQEAGREARKATATF